MLAALLQQAASVQLMEETASNKQGIRPQTQGPKPLTFHPKAWVGEYL